MGCWSHCWPGPVAYLAGCPSGCLGLLGPVQRGCLMQWSSHRLHAWAARPCLPLLGLLSLQQSMSILQAQAGVCKAATTVVGALLTMLAWVLHSRQKTTLPASRGGFCAEPYKLVWTAHRLPHTSCYCWRCPSLFHSAQLLRWSQLPSAAPPATTAAVAALQTLIPMTPRLATQAPTHPAQTRRHSQPPLRGRQLPSGGAAGAALVQSAA